MKAIFKKDFFSLFNNVVGIIFVAVNMAFYGLYFMASNLLSGASTISGTLGGQLLVLLITTPLLTMRSFTEERKNRTDTLLLTSPVSVPKLILGKYFAMVAAFSINVIFIFLSLLFLNLFGDVLWAESLVALLGFWLFGCVCIAIGTFISALFENQVIAAILTIGALLIGYMMSAITSMFSEDSILSKILNIYDLTTPFSNFSSGMIYVSSLIYFISIIFICLFLTGEVLLKRRWTVSISKIKTTAFSTTAILLAIALTIAMNIGVNYIPEIYQTIDVTAEKMFSVADETEDYIKNFDGEVNIYVLSTEENCDTTLHYTLSYFEANDDISIRYIDPDLNPNFAAQFTDDSLSNGSLIIENLENGNVTNVDYYSLYENTTDSYTLYTYMMTYGYDYDELYLMTATGYDGEGQIVSALQYVTQENTEMVYAITGHDETELGSAAYSYIKKRNMGYDTLNLRTDTIPEDCALLILNGPMTDLGTEEISTLETYLDNGGNMMITLSPDAFMYGDNPTPNLYALLETYGIKAVNGILLDENDSYHSATNEFLMYPDLNTASSLLDGISSKPSVLVPYGVPFTISEDENSTAISFLNSSESTLITGVEEATGQTSDVEAEDVEVENDTTDDVEEEEDTEESNTYSLGASLSTDGSGNNNLVVLASAYMFIDNVEAIAPGMNSGLFNNILGEYQTAEVDEASVVVIPSKTYAESNLQFTSLQVNLFAILWIVIIPVLLLIFGITVWVIRRKR